LQLAILLLEWQQRYNHPVTAHFADEGVAIAIYDGEERGAEESFIHNKSPV
jgi:hypothetical protein